jgi:hypothetical protein
MDASFAEVSDGDRIALVAPYVEEHGRCEVVRTGTWVYKNRIVSLREMSTRRGLLRWSLLDATLRLLLNSIIQVQ